ncbi:MAG: PTS sugar transporter subunit IIA [Spirochaetales bacterium]|nr:PTS sugar transporter subunit IIA [Spirochaetales bacterium]
MSLRDLIRSELIINPLEGRDRESVIREMVERMHSASCLQNPDIVIRQILERERMGSTGLNKGIAVPHSRTAEVESLSIVLGLSREGVEYGSLDGKPSKLFFMILAPPDQSSAHIRILSEIAGLSRDDKLIESLTGSESPEDLMALLV